MGFFTKVKQAYKEKEKERAELKKAYKEEYAKERAIQEAGRRLAAREEARERARAKARAPPISERFATGAGRFASGAKSFLQEQAKQRGGGSVDFLGFGGGIDLFGMQPTRPRAKPRARKSSSLRARQGQIVIYTGALPARTTKKKRKKTKVRRQQALGVDWF